MGTSVLQVSVCQSSAERKALRIFSNCECWEKGILKLKFIEMRIYKDWRQWEVVSLILVQKWVLCWSPLGLFWIIETETCFLYSICNAMSVLTQTSENVYGCWEVLKWHHDVTQFILFIYKNYLWTRSLSKVNKLHL